MGSGNHRFTGPTGQGKRTGEAIEPITVLAVFSRPQGDAAWSENGPADECSMRSRDRRRVLQAGLVSAQPLAPTLQAACEWWADRPAITFRGHTLTYAEVAAQVASLAAAYRRIGIRPGDRVVCQLRDCPEHVIAINAAWACGAIHVGTDNDLTGGELAWLVQRTRAAALVFQPGADQPDPLAPLSAVHAASPATRIIIHGSGDDDGAHLNLASMLAGEGSAPTSVTTTPRREDDTALLLLTSGTTGKPKAVMETLPHCWAKMQFFADAFSPAPDDVHLLYLPMGHVFGLRLALLALLSGGRLVLMERFSPREALRLVTKERVTVLPGMPTHLQLLISCLDPSLHEVASLRWAISAAAALPRLLAEQVYARLGVEVLFVYGCSEGFTTLTTARDEILRGSVGSTVFAGPPGTAPAGTVTIVDPESHAPLPVGSTGEIVFGARQPVRYWHDPEVASSGWYHTGDLGRMDEEGRVYIVGRLKELLNRGGLKVAPGEIESALARHPGVSDAAVIATPDPVLGEAICACVVAANGVTPSLADVRTFLAQSLARHKLPDELCTLDGIPRTKIGKVDRTALGALVVDAGVPRERLRHR